MNPKLKRMLMEHRGEGNSTHTIQSYPYTHPERNGIKAVKKMGMAYPAEKVAHSHEKHPTGVEPMTHDRAVEWVKRMENADGTTGPHWDMNQTRQVMEQHNIHLNDIDFWVTMNMMYSDYCKVAKKHNCSTSEFYAAMAKAFLEDKDAYPEKLSRYYECIVEH